MVILEIHNLQINYGRITNIDAHTNIQFTVTPHTSTLHPIVCVPSGGSILLVEMLTGKKIKTLQGHFGSVNCVLTHPFEQVKLHEQSKQFMIMLFELWE